MAWFSYQAIIISCSEGRLNRYWKRGALADDRTGECRTGSTRKLYNRVCANEACFAGNDHRLEIARPRLKQPAAAGFLLYQNFLSLTQHFQVACA